MTEKFPWGALMQFGLVRLALPSQVFWSTTLRELMISARPVMARRNLENLMKEFPDEW